MLEKLVRDALENITVSEQSLTQLIEWQAEGERAQALLQTFLNQVWMARVKCLLTPAPPTYRYKRK
jgi:hypothetical protein